MQNIFSLILRDLFINIYKYVNKSNNNNKSIFIWCFLQGTREILQGELQLETK